MKPAPSDPAELLEQASAWWSTAIIDIRPGVIRPRGKPIEALIGQVTFPQMIWLMLRGELPSAEQARLLEAALVAAVDHGPHAPSIAISRMAVTCGLPLNGAMASAINALDDVHGGAGEQCLELYQRADALARERGAGPVEAAVEQALDEFVAAHGRIIPGFGHRFHPVDPRALQRRTGKALPMNIDGVTAVVYGELGFQPPLARGLFILSRSVGILAHAWEQSQQAHRIKGPMPPAIPYRYTGK